MRHFARLSFPLSALALLTARQVAAQGAVHETGLAFMEPVAYQGIPLAAPLFAGVLPPRVDLVPFATIGDQGSQGSCVGWAVAYAMKTYQEAVERGWSPAVASHRFSPAFIYNLLHTEPTCRAGITYAEALNLVTAQGAAPMDLFPYDPAHCDRKPQPPVAQAAREYRIASWRRVNVADETEVKTHLAAGFPVLIGMPVDQAFNDLKGEAVYQGPLGPSLGGHAMLVSGYDDERGAFEVINSWGVGWGHAGKGWISYTGFRTTVREGYVTQDIVLAPQSPAQVTQKEWDIETIVYSETPLGVKSNQRTTGDHHCERNCEGEPTRTNYKLDLEAEPDSFFRNPKLVCLSGPCGGWNAVLSVRLEEGGRHVRASWDVWAHPTTWELVAEQYRRTESSRFSRKVPVGGSFSVLAETGGVAPLVTGKLPTGESFSFVAGRPTLNPLIRFVDLQVQGRETVYRYQTLVP